MIDITITPVIRKRQKKDNLRCHLCGFIYPFNMLNIINYHNDPRGQGPAYVACNECLYSLKIALIDINDEQQIEIILMHKKIRELEDTIRDLGQSLDSYRDSINDLELELYLNENPNKRIF